ncbi:MAG: hypothetical protein RLY57_338 [Candidatus Parcubacteria bacterium]|jgi:hypothetical protein
MKLDLPFLTREIILQRAKAVSDALFCRELVFDAPLFVNIPEYDDQGYFMTFNPQYRSFGFDHGFVVLLSTAGENCEKPEDQCCKVVFSLWRLNKKPESYEGHDNLCAVVYRLSPNGLIRSIWTGNGRDHDSVHIDSLAEAESIFSSQMKFVRVVLGIMEAPEIVCVG